MIHFSPTKKGCLPESVGKHAPSKTFISKHAHLNIRRPLPFNMSISENLRLLSLKVCEFCSAEIRKKCNHNIINHKCELQKLITEILESIKQEASA